jgi:hypothetical protein
MDVSPDPGKRRMFLDQSEERSGVRSMFLQPDTTADRSPEGQSSRKKILFASVHSVLDFSNGASVATLDVLHGLTACGFECQAFCTANLDLGTGRLDRAQALSPDCPGASDDGELARSDQHLRPRFESRPRGCRAVASHGGWCIGIGVNPPKPSGAGGGSAKFHSFVCQGSEE